MAAAISDIQCRVTTERRTLLKSLSLKLLAASAAALVLATSFSASAAALGNGSASVNQVVVPDGRDKGAWPESARDD